MTRTGVKTHFPHADRISPVRDFEISLSSTLLGDQKRVTKSRFTQWKATPSQLSPV